MSHNSLRSKTRPFRFRGFGVTGRMGVNPRGRLWLWGKVARVPQCLTRSEVPASEPEPAQSTELAYVADEVVARTIHEWQERASYLPGELLFDPAWRMLLELLQAEIERRRVSLVRLRKLSGVPASTADRWLKALERQALVIRQGDPHDTGHETVSLSANGSSALRRYFREVLSIA